MGLRLATVSANDNIPITNGIREVVGQKAEVFIFTESSGGLGSMVDCLKHLPTM